jgi:hypothetical protein
MRFYGLSLDQVYGMENEAVMMLFGALIALEAQENLTHLRVQDWPNMKKEARTKLFKDLNKLANPSIVNEEQKALTTEDLAALLNGR